MPKDSDDLEVNERVVIKAVGVIQSINSDGSYDIFNKSDGKLLKNMPSSIVIAWRKRTLNKGPRGMTLVANYRGSGEWLPGTISDERDDGTFTFSYDDGKIETKVQKSRIRYEFRSDDATEKEPKSYWGWEVEWRGKDGKVAIGRVVAEDENGDIYIKYGPTDKAKVTIVTKKDIKPLNPPIARADFDDQDAAKATIEDNEMSGVFYSLDDVVDVYDKITSKWLTGTVILCRTDGTYDVEHNSGMYERVSADDMRLPKVNTETSTNKSNAHNSKEKLSLKKPSTTTGTDVDQPEAAVIHNYWGPKVEVKQKDSDEWKVGRVTGESTDEKFQITYANSRTELVTKDDIRLFKKVPAPHPSKSKDNAHSETDNHKSSQGKNSHQGKEQINNSTIKHTYTIGQRVFVDYKSEGKFYKGRIIAVKSGEKYNIEYDDGDIENNVPMKRIQQQLAPSAAVAPLSEVVESYYGPLVKANYRGSGKWCVARVTGETSDGGFEVAYIQTGEIAIVGKRDIRPLTPTESATAEAEERAMASANKGRHRDDRDDREQSLNHKDHRRDRRSVESAGSASVSTAAAVYESGDVVEVNYPDEGIWLRGVVALTRSNGTVDVEFDDGSFDQRISARFVRKFTVQRSIRRQPPTRDDRDSGRDNDRHSSYDRNTPSHSRADRYDSSPESGRRQRVDPVAAGYSRSSDREYSARGVPARYNKDADDDQDYDHYDSRHPPHRAGSPSANKRYERESRDSRGRGRDDSSSPIRSRNSTGGGGSGGGGSTSAAVGNKRGSPPVMVFTPGDDVECDFSGKGHWKLGRVRLARSDGSFDIRFDDGSDEVNVLLECLRPVSRGAPRSSSRASASPSRGMRDMKLSPSSAAAGNRKYYSPRDQHSD